MVDVIIATKVSLLRGFGDVHVIGILHLFNSLLSKAPPENSFAGYTIHAFESKAPLGAEPF